MKPTAMQKSVEKEGSKTMPASSATSRPRHSTTITVGSNSVRPPSSASLTSPLQRRLSGELTQILGDRDEPAAGESARISVTANGDRKTMPTLTAARDPREPILVKASSVPPVRAPLYKISSLTPSANSSHSQSFTSPFKSPTDVESDSPATRSAQGALFRSNSGGSAALSPDIASSKVNGYSDSSMNSDTDAYHLNDFYASLPSLPADELVSQRRSLSPPSKTPAVKPTCVSQSPRTSRSEMQQRDASPEINANKSVLTFSPSPNHPPTSDARQPKSSLRKNKKAPRPPPMSGIAENGACGEEREISTNGDDALQIPPESFHVNVKSTPLSASAEVPEEEEASFAGRRDLTDGRSLREKRILSSKGTIRGFKNRVRAGIATFIDQASKKFNYRTVERGQIVMYMTSMTVVRETHERCKRARNILHTHMVRYEQRDAYLSHEHQRQLRERLDSAHEVPLPQIFIDGQHLGGAVELEKLNESGELRKLLHRFPKIQVRGLCEACGGFRFVPCEVCHGSKKSLHRNHFTEEFSALRCTHCNENGLQRCLHCLNHAE